ncbi:hypothetical protein [Roseomonas sp. KE0001]|uniref:hypothetical protein n=1 Tax=Roseomonas sp. KE0001 TaxID=2479201 RepID=UPI001E32B80A|nr:hypothetical protein [Roseomonas sp. KE0001]
MFSLLGVVGGLWAQKMDQQTAATNFIIAPLTLLSGTLDGFQHGFAGTSEAPPEVGIAVVLNANILLGVLCYRLLASGWCLRQ